MASQLIPFSTPVSGAAPNHECQVLYLARSLFATRSPKAYFGEKPAIFRFDWNFSLAHRSIPVLSFQTGIGSALHCLSSPPTSTPWRLGSPIYGCAVKPSTVRPTSDSLSLRLHLLGIYLHKIHNWRPGFILQKDASSLTDSMYVRYVSGSFHSACAVLFTFPQYWFHYPLSAAYLALADGPLPDRISRVPSVNSGFRYLQVRFCATGEFSVFVPDFPAGSQLPSISCVYNPTCVGVGLLPSLAAILGKSLLFSFARLLGCFGCRVFPLLDD